MTDDLVFKEAVPVSKKKKSVYKPIKGKTPSVPTEEGKTKPPIILHQTLTGIPYTAEFFEVKGIWDNPDLTLKEDVETIEEYYKQKVQSAEIEDDPDNFLQLIKEAEKVTNSKNSPSAVRIAKIAEWMRFMGNIKKIDRLKNTYG